MPHKKGPAGEVEAEKAKTARWRYAIRHPEFREDLRRVSRLHRKNRKEYARRFDDLLEKWGFQYVGLEIIESLPLLRSDPSRELDFLEAYSKVVLSFPVFSHESERGEQIVNLRIDLNHPLDLLVALVEEELRELKDEFQSGAWRRRRLDKVDFYLAVYDRAEQGQTFGSIAKTLKGRPSTVKSAYLAASRNIFGPKGGPSKKALPLASFDAVGHCQKCPICQKAQTVEEFCPKALLYANQEEKGQQELPGYDTVSG